MSDEYINSITPTFYEPCGFDYDIDVVKTRKIINKYMYMVSDSSFDNNGDIVGGLFEGVTNVNGKFCQNGKIVSIAGGYYRFFISVFPVTNVHIAIKKNMCSNRILITEDWNQTVQLPFFPAIQTLINGSTVKGVFSEPAIALLKRFENPPVVNGMTGLHNARDGGLTYGYGEFFKGYTVITPALKTKYPDMTLAQADQRLRNTVLVPFINQVNNRVAWRNMLFTSNQFDAFVSIEYNVGDCGDLMTAIRTIENSNSANKAYEIYNAIIHYHVTYPGLRRRRRAEAAVYFHGFYDETFFYP